MMMVLNDDHAMIHGNGARIACHMQLCLGQSPKSESSTSRYLLRQPLSYELYNGENSDFSIYAWRIKPTPNTDCVSSKNPITILITPAPN